MKRKEKEELLSTNCLNVNEDEIDDYIKKYVKLKRVNKAKIASIIIVPTLFFGTFAGIMVGHTLGVSEQYSNIEIAKYDVKYADSNSDFIIQEDITDNDCNVIKSIITVKYPFENVNGCYVRKVVNYATNDRDINEKVKNIIHSQPEHIKELINVVDETYTYEVTENIDKQNNDTEITITYSHITDTYWDKIKKSSEEKKNEYVLSFISAITAGTVGSIFLIPAYDPIDKENAYLNEKIKILKKRRKRNN